MVNTKVESNMKQQFYQKNRAGMWQEQNCFVFLKKPYTFQSLYLLTYMHNKINSNRDRYCIFLFRQLPHGNNELNNLNKIIYT